MVSDQTAGSTNDKQTTTGTLKDGGRKVHTEGWRGLVL